VHHSLLQSESAILLKDRGHPYELPDFGRRTALTSTHFTTKTLGQRVYRAKGQDVSDLKQRLIDV